MFSVEVILSNVKYIHLTLEGNAFLSKIYAWDGS
jgi:hypothetical protein